MTLIIKKRKIVKHLRLFESRQRKSVEPQRHLLAEWRSAAVSLDGGVKHGRAMGVGLFHRSYFGVALLDDIGQPLQLTVPIIKSRTMFYPDIWKRIKETVSKKLEWVNKGKVAYLATKRPIVGVNLPACVTSSTNATHWHLISSSIVDVCLRLIPKKWLAWTVFSLVQY